MTVSPDARKLNNDWQHEDPLMRPVAQPTGTESARAATGPTETT
jgi:hypothetical protein